MGSWQILGSLLAAAAVIGADNVGLPENGCASLPDGSYSLGCSHQYFMCSNGNSYAAECPAGLYYNEATIACDYIENVGSCNGQPRADEPAQPLHRMDEMRLQAEQPIQENFQPGGPFVRQPEPSISIQPLQAPPMVAAPEFQWQQIDLNAGPQQPQQQQQPQPQQQETWTVPTPIQAQDAPVAPQVPPTWTSLPAQNWQQQQQPAAAPAPPADQQQWQAPAPLPEQSAPITPAAPQNWEVPAPIAPVADQQQQQQQPWTNPAPVQPAPAADQQQWQVPAPLPVQNAPIAQPTQNWEVPAPISQAAPQQQQQQNQWTVPAPLPVQDVPIQQWPAPAPVQHWQVPAPVAQAPQLPLIPLNFPQPSFAPPVVFPQAPVAPAVGRRGRCQAGKLYTRGDCMDTYWQCINGVDFAQLTCPQGQAFDQVSLACQLFDNVATCVNKELPAPFYVNNAARFPKFRPPPRDEVIEYTFNPHRIRYDRPHHHHRHHHQGHPHFPYPGFDQSGPFESREEDDIVLDNFRTNRHPVGESVMFGPFFVKTRHHRRHHHHHRRHEHREIRVPTYTEDAFEGRIPKEIKSNPFFDGRHRNRVEVEDVLDKRPGQLTDSIFKFFPATKRSDRRRDDKSHKSHKKHKKSNSDEVEGSGTDSGMESGDDDGDNVVKTKALRLIG